MARKSYVLVFVGIVVLVAIALRLALPHFAADYVNRQLHAMASYEGSVQDVDIHLWRGAYSVHGIRIIKKGGARPIPFFQADHVDFSVEWRSLLHGRLVAEGVFVAPDLNLVQAEDKQKSQLGTEVDWVQKIKAMSPFKFNSIRVRDGRVTFTAPGIETKDALTAEHVDGELLNLTNVVAQGNEAFATFNATARVLGNAPITVDGRLDPWAAQPTFDVRTQLNGVQLPRVNPWLDKYIKAEAERGEFELYLEAAAADGRFKGYAKPFMRDVEIKRSDPAEGPVKKLWENIVDFAAEVLKNKDTGDVAARIPFSGTVKNPKAGVFETMLSVLHNAFVSAFSRSLENSISLRDVQKNLRGYQPEAERR